MTTDGNYEEILSDVCPLARTWTNAAGMLHFGGLPGNSNPQSMEQCHHIHST